MKNLKVVFPLIGLVICSFYSFMLCEASIEDNIHGIWINHAYEDRMSIYKKSDAFQEDKPGFQLNTDGTLLKRQNIGWCGTPPVSYGNYDGKWEKIGANQIRIEYDYWGGRDTLMFEIVTYDDKLLKLKRIAK